MINLLPQAKITNLYINIHSHFPAKENEWALQNLAGNFDQQNLPPQFSAGLHPWYIDKNYESQLEQLKQLSRHPALLAIGETGLDKLCNTDFTLQQQLFQQQVMLANQVSKPLIIHCVKSFDEVLELLQRSSNKVPVLFHGFNKSGELALQLTRKGYYLAFGSSLRKAHIASYLPQLPLQQVLFETDDDPIPVQSIYELATTALHISMDELSLQIQKNAEAFLGKKL